MEREIVCAAFYMSLNFKKEDGIGFVRIAKCFLRKKKMKTKISFFDNKEARFQRTLLKKQNYMVRSIEKAPEKTMTKEFQKCAHFF